MQQNRGDGGIDAAGQAADHSALAHLFADARDGVGAKRAHVPVGRDAGDLDHKIAQQRGAARSVHDLGMELHAVEAARLVGDGGERRVFRRRYDVEGGRDRGDLVAVAHPHRLAALGVAKAGQQRRRFHDGDVGAAELARMPGLDAPAKLLAHRHLAIADAQHRHAGREHALGGARRIGFGDAGRSAGKNDGTGRPLLQHGFRHMEGHDLAIDPRLAHAPRDELGHLRAEVDHQNGSGHSWI